MRQRMEMPLPSPALRPRASDDRAAARVVPRCPRPLPDCACGNGGATLADAHTDAEPEFRGRGLLIGIDVDDIKPGEILTTGAWHCTAPGCGLVHTDRAVIEDHIAHLRRQPRFDDGAGADRGH